MNIRELIKQIDIDKDAFKALHIIRFFSSFVIISKGKVIKVTDPYMEYCPLASFLYNDIKKSEKLDPESIKKAIIKAIDEKISKFGHFTEKRGLYRNDIAIPYGASEILMYAMRKKVIDAAVVVCDGAGTVIVSKPGIVQGIGARMNGLFFTTPLYKIMEKLEKANSRIVFQDAHINQIEGAKKAASLGYKNIAVTINGFMDEDLSRLKEIEEDYEISITSLIVCTTGVTEKRIHEIEKYADLVWSCASEEIREIIGKEAILQLSKKIPVFVLTRKGLNLVSGYSSDGKLVKNSDSNKQYIIAGSHKGRKIKMGNFDTYLSEAKLPIRHRKQPKLLPNVLFKKICYTRYI